ncbi:DUF397 domain-containing protein [Micromonospora sp. CPCC 205371]|nr:DUF397 domain-containing protein [Micromonospora sp. CPCC 205371]
MPQHDLTFRKSTKSHENECVEVADTADASYCRDSKQADGPVLRFPRAAWGAFIAGIKAGDL